MEQPETAAAVEGDVLTLMTVVQHVDSSQYRCWTQASAAVWTWADWICAEIRAVAAMSDGERVAADQHTPTAYRQPPPGRAHAHHQGAAEADVHMQEGCSKPSGC